MNSNLHDCFLSYRSSDRQEAGVVYEHLTSAGFTVWWDEKYLHAGTQWHEEIERHCEASAVVIPLLTPEWKHSEWTRYETYVAACVIPIILRGTWAAVATPPIARYQYASMDLQSATEVDWRRVFESIRKQLVQPRPQRSNSDRKTLMKTRPIDHFVGRDLTLVDLNENLFAHRTAALTQRSVIAIPALGGVGKTTLARHYAEVFWRCYRHMFWVDAFDIKAGFAEIHDLLHPGLQEALSTDARAERSLLDLSQPGAPMSLLIIDNATDEQSILPWIPKSGDCHVLITSRFEAWSTEIRKFDLWLLDKEPARELLLRVSGRSDAGAADAADAVAEKLQYLPLALEQAAAYVKEQPGIGFQDYLRLYLHHERELLSHKAVGVTNYADPVYLTWLTTIDKLPEGARAILRLHAFFAPTPFPIDLYLKGAAVLAHEIKDAPVEVVPTEFTVREWIASLIRYCMAKSEQNGCISVHSLVQSVERHRMEPGVAIAAHHATELYLSGVPEPTPDSGSRTLWARLVGHSRTLAGSVFVSDSQRTALYSDLSSFFRYSSRLTEAVEAAVSALKSAESLAGPEDPLTAKLINNLATLLGEGGDYKRATALHRKALVVRETVLGPDHPETLSSLGNLAQSTFEQGDLLAAEPLFRRAIERSRLVQGGDHEDTLTILSNYAELMRTKGDLRRAGATCLEVLKSRRRTLGAHHSKTLLSTNNYAAVLHAQGDFRVAEQLLRRNLEELQDELGPDHSDTLSSMSNLGALLEAQAKYTGAEPFYRNVLAARERILGPEHPLTLTSLSNLGSLLQNQEHYEAAEPFLRRALSGRLTLFGEHHPDTLRSLNQLATVLSKAGRIDEAKPLFGRAISIGERDLGSSHPEVLYLVNNLATLHARQGNHKEAVRLYDRALKGFRSVLGPRHPSTLTVAESLAASLKRLR